ncbi:MAG: LuxR C-terminal-related transcriptional regulator [Anaerostipes sp.]|nr:LuxR C-terminal-related transcriptional regulator [Anaerostipes sp.]
MGVKRSEEIYVRPLAAYKKWNVSKSMNQTVYLYGASGYGKTTFIKNGLKRKKHDYYSMKDGIPVDIPVLQNRKTNIIVIDDLHTVFDEVEQEHLAHMISELSVNPSVWLILAGRGKVPVWLMTIYIRDIFTVITEEDLALNQKEVREYFSLWGLEFDEDMLMTIIESANGSPLVLRLVAMDFRDRGVFTQKDIERIRQQLWNYLEVHVYGQWDFDMQEFLMQVSVVETFSLEMAEMITGRRDSAWMIKNAMGIGNFLNYDGKYYTYVPTMKLSMRRRLELKYNKEQRNNIYYNAGLYYEIHGDNLNALHMYEMSENKERIYTLLVANARENPGSGQYYELRHYYMNMPEEMLMKSFELMAGRSMLESMLMNLEESEIWYERLKEYAMRQVGNEKKQAQNQLLYLDIALPHRGSVHMIEIMKYAGSVLKNGKVVLPEFSVTSNLPSMINGGKDFCEWSKKDRELANTIGPVVEFVLGKYGKGLISLALAESFFEKGGDRYEVANLANRGKMKAENGGKTEQIFVAIGILSWLHIIDGHPEEALELLEHLKERAENELLRNLLGNLESFKCRIWMYQGELSLVNTWLETAPDERKDFFTMERFRYLTKVRIYILKGQHYKALSLLGQIAYYANTSKRTYILMEIMLLRAIVWHRMGNEKWKEELQKVITKAEEYHFVRILSREGEALWELLRNRKWQWTDEQFKKQVICETESMARCYPSYLKEKQATEADFSENARNILRFQAEGMTNVQIAEELGIKPDTVKYHARENYKKLGVKSKAAAVTAARKRKLIY